MNDVNQVEAEGDEPEANDDAYQTRDLSSILSRGTAEPAPAAKDTGEKPPQATPPAQQGDADGQAKAKDAPPASDDDPKNWRDARQALKSVTDQNKELKRQIEDLTRKVMAPKAEPQKREDVPDPLVDPAGFKQHLRDEFRLEQIEASRADMIEEVGEAEFGAAEAAFIAAARTDPKLAEKLQRSRDPARVAWREGKKLLESKPDPNKDREALEAEITAKVMAKLGLNPDGTPLDGKPAAAKPRTVAPTSLADARSATPPPAPAWEGPRPLSSLIGRRR